MPGCLLCSSGWGFGLSASPRPSVRVFLFVGVYSCTCVCVGQRSASDVVPKYLPTSVFLFVCFEARSLTKLGTVCAMTLWHLKGHSGSKPDWWALQVEAPWSQVNLERERKDCDT